MLFYSSQVPQLLRGWVGWGIISPDTGGFPGSDSVGPDAVILRNVNMFRDVHMLPRCLYVPGALAQLLS